MADYVTGKLYDKYQWVIPIHDAFLVPPQAAEDCKYWYAEALTEIYRNRKIILSKYFDSIGITGAAQAEWEAITAKVVPIHESFQCSTFALK